ncbi:hypothetical protein M758_8G148900 [Ceratodon purpureus]|nr:hypothetical protein M758_8G148900 [Ceratodon purpureus]KAG0608989.1 hypothetical protein M758_8G148900 [Ceratodon purpureus]KAG0608990.1 hypothetical protein M758_8G148900 [Ceratodon purpureus]KAG0608991.1 hypothetical protein M758_8G148900 [Ceratodon purpureus]
METLVCRAGNSIPSMVASTSKLSTSRSSRSQSALLGGSHSPQLLRVMVLPQVNAKRNEMRNFVVFAKGDAHREAMEDQATLGSERETLPDVSQSGSQFQTASLPSWIVVTFGVALLISTAFFPSVSLGPLGFLREGLYSVGSAQVWQSVFYVGAVAHVVEASVALYLARRVDPQNEALWFWQTLFLGFFSLRTLLEKSKQENLRRNL